MFAGFIRLNGKPFNCADDISAYYEIKDCGEMDELRVSVHWTLTLDELKSYKSNCYWKNGPDPAKCNEFNLQDNKADVVDKGKTFTENWDSKAQSIGTLLSYLESST